MERRRTPASPPISGPAVATGPRRAPDRCSRAVGRQRRFGLDAGPEAPPTAGQVTPVPDLRPATCGAGLVRPRPRGTPGARTRRPSSAPRPRAGHARGTSNRKTGATGRLPPVIGVLSPPGVPGRPRAACSDASPSVGSGRPSAAVAPGRGPLHGRTPTSRVNRWLGGAFVGSEQPETSWIIITN